MRRYEDKETTIVTRSECVECVCDMCGRKAEYPESSDMPFGWGAVGLSRGEVKAEYIIEGEYNYETLDLCYECVEYLIKQIKKGKIKRP